MKKQFAILVIGFAVAVALPMLAASSPKGGILYTFRGGSDGNLPFAPLVADAKGNLYGTTSEGGGSICNGGEGCGTIFELIAPASPSGTWQEKVLYAFAGGADGSYPVGGLILDSGGNLYGTTEWGGDLNSTACGNPQYGCGVVFELSPPKIPGGAWTETVLYAFEGAPDGAGPETALVFDKAGNLYGTTVLGGTENAGAIFELSPNSGGTWAESVIYSFMGLADGELPTSSPIFDTSGNLYGTTFSTVYQLVPPISGGTWSLNTINVFNNKYAIENGGLLFDPSGDLFVALTYSGEKGNGVAFELIPPQSSGPWTEVTLHNFNGGSDAHPNGLVEDASGNLYGTTQGNQNNAAGEIFKLANLPNGWVQTVLHSFSDTRLNQGLFPQAPLVYGKWKALYGTTWEGGGSNKNCYYGCGTVFGFLP